MLRSKWMRVTSRLLALLLLLASAARLPAADPVYQLKVVTDRKDAIYESGSDAKFLITVSKGDEVVPNAAVKFVVDDFLKSGEAAGLPAASVTTSDQPGVVAVTGKQPGFLKCQVSFDAPDGKKLQAAAGAGFSPTKIGLSLPVPDDFDAFWTEQKKLLAAVPLEPQLTRADQPGMKDDLECFDVQIKCLGDAPVSGYFARPKNAKPKSLPAILWVHGAGVRSSAAGNAIQGAKHGMLSLDINAHGIPNGKPAEFYTELTNGRLKDYRATGTCPPSSCYAAFNALRGKKEMLNEPLMNHAAPPHIQEAFLARVLDHIKCHSVQ